MVMIMTTTVSLAGKSPSMDMLLELVPSLEELDWYACLTSSALQRGDVAVCRFLIEHGVDVNIVDPRKRQTALHHASTRNTPFNSMSLSLLPSIWETTTSCRVCHTDWTSTQSSTNACS
jgi:hypothetical protein